jgi:hypothetical protein
MFKYVGGYVCRMQAKLDEGMQCMCEIYKSDHCLLTALAFVFNSIQPRNCFSRPRRSSSPPTTSNSSSSALARYVPGQPSHRMVAMLMVVNAPTTRNAAHNTQIATLEYLNLNFAEAVQGFEQFLTRTQHHCVVVLYRMMVVIIGAWLTLRAQCRRCPG